MDQAEAEKFIAAEVSKLLWQRLLLVASLFGIVNVIAFVSLWKSITEDAHKVAEDQVKRSATEYAEKALDKFAEITSEAKKRITDLDADYAGLYKSIGGTTTEMTHLQSSEKTIEASLIDLSNQSAKLLSGIQAIKISDAQHAVEVINAVKNLSPDQKEIVAGLADLTPRFEKLSATVDDLKSEMNDKVSTTKTYRIKSSLGNWAAGVNDGKGYIGSAMSIAAWDNKTPAVFWTFVEEEGSL